MKEIINIKLTQEQYDEFEYAKKELKSSELPKILKSGDSGSWSVLDELSGRLFGHKQGEMTDENIEDIMQMWLFPDLITIIDN